MDEKEKAPEKEASVEMEGYDPSSKQSDKSLSTCLSVVLDFVAEGKTAFRAPTTTVNLETWSLGRLTILGMHLDVDNARIAGPTSVQKSCADNGPPAALAGMD